MKLIVETARYEQHLHAALSDQHPLRNRLTCPLLADKKKKKTVHLSILSPGGPTAFTMSPNV